MIRNCWWWISRAAVPFLTIPFFLYVPLADAQGTVEDYQRAQRFLPGNLLRRLVYVADVHPNWIEKTNRFWYRKVGPTRTEFILVDAERNTSGPAFDHSQVPRPSPMPPTELTTRQSCPLMHSSSWIREKLSTPHSCDP